MSARPRRHARRSGWLLQLALVLATMAQLAGTVLPVLDGWKGLGAGPHVETLGGPAHYAHAEDACVACQGRAVDPRPTITFRLAVGIREVANTHVPGAAVAPVAAPTTRTRSRAPPSVT